MVLQSIERPTWRTRIGERLRGRGAPFLLALLVEGLIVLVLMTLAPRLVRREPVDMALSTFDAAEVSEKPPAAASAPRPAAAPPPPSTERPREADNRPPPSPVPSTVQPPVVKDFAPKAPWIELSRDQMAQADIGRAPPPGRAGPPAPRAAMGPPDTGFPGDTPRVDGSGPNGEPLYAAAWYREPYDSELAGYLSSAAGPGWGMIMCRTVPDYRVEDCEMVGESPGSRMGRAVLAAAWQFRVRPPRVGGKSKYGEWVRIRITYGVKQRRFGGQE